MSPQRRLDIDNAAKRAKAFAASFNESAAGLDELCDWKATFIYGGDGGPWVSITYRGFSNRHQYSAGTYKFLADGIEHRSIPSRLHHPITNHSLGRLIGQALTAAEDASSEKVGESP